MYDICIIGSGAGGIPAAWYLAKKKLKVAVIERGSHHNISQLAKDELSICHESPFIPQGNNGLREIIFNHQKSIYYNGLWTAVTVGGGTKIMSAFMMRMKEKDFIPYSVFGNIKDANLCDWPISYQDLSSYYDEVERIIGISPSKLCNLPPLKSHSVSEFLKSKCQHLGIETKITPRAILSEEKDGRGSCSYSGLCGSYPCLTEAKGSMNVSFLRKGIKNGNLVLHQNSYVYKINSKGDQIKSISLITPQGSKEIKSRIFILSAGAIESARLLLNSRPTGSNGLANSSNQVGKNLTFTMPCEVTGFFNQSLFATLTSEKSPFYQRYTDHFYTLPYKELKYKQGGTVIFIPPHPNPINRMKSLSYSNKGERIFGLKLKEKINDFYNYNHISTDSFISYLPTDNNYVTLSNKRDNFGIPVSKIFYTPHRENIIAKEILAFNLSKMFEAMGADKCEVTSTPFTAGELQQGTCRMGENRKNSVINSNCQSWDIKNLFITDSSFMPTGIPIPSTFTIMANSLRVGKKIYSIL